MNLKKVILWITSIIAIIIIGSASYIYYNAQSIANDILREEIIKKYNTSPQTQYLISLERVKLNLLTSSIKLINLKVIPKDSLITLKRNIDGKLLENTFIEIHISEIYLKNFDYLKALTNRVVDAEKFEIKNPVVHVYQHEGQRLDVDKKQDTIDIRSVFLANYDTLKIENILINNASTSYHKVSNKMDTTNIFSLHNLSYQITGVVMNNSTLYSDEYISFKQYFLKSKNINAKLGNGTTINVAAINYNSTDRKLIISELELEPKNTPKQHFKSIKYRKGWIKLGINKIEIDSIDIKNWIKTNEIYASNLTIKQPVLNIHSNSKTPLDPSKTSPMLGHMLTSINLPFYIENVAIKDATIALDLIGLLTDEHGKLIFSKLNLQANNFTNIDREINTNPFLKISATTKLNGTGKVKTNLTIDLISKSSKTRFTLNATDIDLKEFNSVLSPILRIKITDGQMVSLKINSSITTKDAIGTMDAYYANLKILFEAKEVNKKPGFFNKVVSGIANGVIKTENNPGNKNYRQGQFKFEKQSSDSFFKMLWLVTLHGLEDSIIGSEGRDNRKQNKMEKKKDKSEKKKWSFSKK